MKNLQYARVGNVRAKASNGHNTNNHQRSTGFVKSFNSSENESLNNTLNNISCK